MTESTQDASAAYTTALLVHYCFELKGNKAEVLVRSWLSQYQPTWVRLAVIEALYQGRYKAVSVEQILATWNRRGRALYHFNHDFERLIGRKFPQNITAPPDAASLALSNAQSLTLSKSSPSVFPEDANPSSTASATYQKAPLPATVISLEGTATQVNPDEPACENLTGQLADAIAKPTSTVEAKKTGEASLPSSHIDTTETMYQADWSRWEAGKHPIHQFTPSVEVSDFYLKLKAIAQNPEGAIADLSTTVPRNSNTEPD